MRGVDLDGDAAGDATGKGAVACRGFEHPAAASPQGEHGFDHRLRGEHLAAADDVERRGPGGKDRIGLGGKTIEIQCQASEGAGRGRGIVRVDAPMMGRL